MKRKLFFLQCAACGLIVLGVAGLGVVLFGRGEMNLTAVYVFGAIGFVGFVSNAVVVVIRVLWEKGWWQ